MRRILLIAIGLSTVLLADFSRTGNIVTDTTTGLQWQNNETVIKKWTEAIEYCEALSLDGHDDWRLPNIRELTSLVDDSRAVPAMNGAFVHTTFYGYWSSTTYKDNSSHAWYVGFRYGTQSEVYKGYNYNVVRCVRAGQ